MKNYLSQMKGSNTVCIVKKTDEVKAEDTVLANDNELFFQPQPNTNYALCLVIWLVSGTAPDFKWSLAIPSGTAVMPSGTVNAVNSQATEDATGVHAVSQPDSDEEVLRIEIALRVGATVTTPVAFQWSQNASSVVTTTVKACSKLEYAKQGK